MGSESNNGRVTAWMPFYIGDYLGDTLHLTLAQHGAYILAIFAYWRKGEALTDQELKRITGPEYNTAKEFFVWCDGRWNHKRIDWEIKKAIALQASARAKALKGVYRRRELGLLPMAERGLELDGGE